MKQFNNLKNSGENQNVIKRYILHFEVNNTLTLVDTPNGLTKEENLHHTLAAYAWGKNDSSSEPPQWKLMHNFFCVNKPNSEYTSYHDYVVSSEPDQAKRTELFCNFIKQGQVGAKLKADYEKIIKQLNLPRQVVDEMKISKDQMQHTNHQTTMMATKNQSLDEEAFEKHELVQLFQDGKYFILPYFFKFLVNLKKNKKDFGIVLRSAGQDLEEVVKEMNYFAHGQHPCFSGKGGLPLVRFDGAKGTRNLVIDQPNKCVLYSQGQDNGNLVGAFGTLERHEGGYDKLEELYEKEVYEEAVELVKDSTRTFVKIQENLKESSCVAIKDDNAPRALYIDQADYSTLHVLFDSTIQTQGEQAVDLRDVVTHQKIPFKKALNKYIVPVEPLSVIRDADYFMKCLKECEANRLEEIDRIERGEEDEVDQEQQPPEDLWQNLMNADHATYLRHTVMPLLYPALQLVDRERPDDPILQIAMYMLKNKDKVQIPEPPKRVEPKEGEEKPQEAQ